MEYQLIVYRLYGIWSGMMQRCNNPKNPGYKNYGGRGISVCYEWRNDPKQFIEDMYPSYVKGLTIDRIDNNGDYCKDNCKWSTRKEQANNRRNSSGIVNIGTLKGTAKSICRELKLNYDKIKEYKIKNNYTWEEAINNYLGIK